MGTPWEMWAYMEQQQHNSAKYLRRVFVKSVTAIKIIQVIDSTQQAGSKPDVIVMQTSFSIPGEYLMEQRA